MISAEKARNNTIAVETIKNEWLDVIGTHIENESYLGRRNYVFTAHKYSDHAIICEYIVPELVKLGYTVKWGGPFLEKTEFEISW